MALTDSLVAYWKLDGNSNDVFGTYNGTDTSVSYSTTSGKIVQGGAFTRTGNSKIATTYQFPTGTNVKSFSVWFKPSSGRLRGWMIGGGTESVGTAFGLFLATDGVGDLYFFGFGAGDVNFGNVVSASVWQHVVITYDGTNLVGYLNGALLSSTVKALNTGTGNMYIGRRTSNTESWDGDIDEVGVWNRALTQNEVLNLYRNGAGNAYTFLSPTNSLTNFNTPSVRSASGVSVTERTM